MKKIVLITPVCLAFMAGVIMRKILIAILIVLSFSSIAFAITETCDSRAIPVVVYGKTSEGVLVPVLTDATGEVQVG